MPLYRKKPIIIEAIQYNGKNALDVFNFCKGSVIIHSGSLIVKTLEGNIKANVGDYIIKGINGEFYPCKSEIFEKTYESI